MSTVKSVLAESPPQAPVHYSRYDRADMPPGWVLYVSPSDTPVKRLVVFVHGFGGKAVKTWLEFPLVNLADSANKWWREADLLFIGYRSTRDSITAVANRIRAMLPRFFPVPYRPALDIEGARIRGDIETPYDELVVVGHSLGGVILRLALCDSAQQLAENGTVDVPGLTTAKVRYFSPASGGFRAAGMLGLVQASSFWLALEAFLRRSSAYTDLQQDSLVLRELRERTVDLVTSDPEKFQTLRARTVWANPEDVVLDHNYRTDFVSRTWDGQSHTSVCKPLRDQHSLPWQFVETGCPIRN